ncbi:unnamed protein product [Diabrotica balteata]|uniref:At5g54830-like domain-containing protein n=1 Tax=Diabrotica balteata TaxID=107213 RepID=A0A9N9T770_DIABA|nr:unnamed protein product [Diabrotica balteata]
MDADDFPSFGAYQRSLELKCDQGEPGFIQWTPDKNTPDTVYYHCFTHRYLGWKIHVLDSCDRKAEASEIKPAIVPAPQSILDKLDTDLEDSPSLRVETRVKQINIITEDIEDKDTKSIISEKVTSAPVEKSSEQLPNLNPLQTPAQQYFHLRTRPNFHYYQQPEHLHYFKPSTLLNTGLESTKTILVPSTTSTTTTTTITTTSSEKPTTPKLVDNIAVASDNLANETYLVPPPLHYHENVNVIYRRPVNYLPMPVKMVPQGAYLKRYYGGPHVSYKKPILRVPNYRYKQPAVSPYIVYVKQPPLTTKAPIENQVRPFIEKPVFEEIRNIEISPQQASTEKEPEIQTAPSTSVADIVPNFLRPAFNTGFKPGSIKIESGFKPIITKEFQDRIDEDEPVVEYESEKGVLQINDTEKFETKPIHAFEPMFIPSPPFKPTKEKKVKITKRPVSKKRQQYTKIVVKRPRSISDILEEPIAEANERVESYYLPPTNAQPVEVVREPSNIDIDVPESNPMLGTPPDIVITYDGKKLSGQSLTAKLSDRPTIVSPRLSKASAYLTARPQFGRFRGELPPLNLDFINKNAPQLQNSAGVLNRELDTPLPSENEQKTISTRLSRVKSI